jgi:PAS domain-containing protein
MADEHVQKTLEELSRNLQESKARLEEAQRVAHVGHWEWDLETDVVVWSDETYRIFGLSPQERPMARCDDFVSCFCRQKLTHSTAVAAVL